MAYGTPPMYASTWAGDVLMVLARANGSSTSQGTIKRGLTGPTGLSGQEGPESTVTLYYLPSGLRTFRISVSSCPVGPARVPQVPDLVTLLRSSHCGLAPGRFH